MEIPTFSEEKCKRKIVFFRSLVARASVLTAAERAELRREIRAFADSLRLENAVLGGAGVGLGAAVLPVIGLLTGPVIGGAYGAYRAHKLSRYRQEAIELLRELDR